MVLDQLENNHKFTNSEQCIADYIAKNPFSLNDLTAEELGALTLTSKSTVFRFCKKLNVNSFEELKRVIQQENIEKNKVRNIKLNEPFNKNSGVKDILGKLPNFYNVAITNTNIMLNKEIIRSITVKLKQAESIDFYCSGITASIADNAIYKFQTLGKQCNKFTNVNEHYLICTKNKNHVSIILSFTGSNKHALSSVKKIKASGQYVLGIGGTDRGSLGKHCDDFLQVYDKNIIVGFEMMLLSISMSYILDVLFTSLMIHDYNLHYKNSLEVAETYKG